MYSFITYYFAFSIYIPSWEQEGFFMERFQPVRGMETINQDLKRQRIVQQGFNTAIGFKPSDGDLLHRSYIPASDRFHVEKSRKALEDDYREEMRKNIETNLMERYRVIESVDLLVSRDGALYSERFLKDPLWLIFQRGVEYRKQHGSQELDREGWNGELGGWAMIEQVMTDIDTPIGTRVVSFSPPGILTESAYKGKFVDIYEVVELFKKRTVKRTRIAVDYSEEDYKQQALLLEPYFFDNYDNRPLDAWYLSHPVICQFDVVTTITKGKGMSPELFQRVFTWSEEGIPLQRFVEHYIDLIYQESLSEKEVYLAFNAILNRADEIVAKITRKAKHSDVPLYRNQRVNNDINFFEDVSRLGRLKVVEVSGGGCPGNKGFDVFGAGVLDPFEKLMYEKTIFSNSVAKFGIDTTNYKDDPNLCRCGGREPHFHCPGENGKCSNIIIVGKGITSCSKCGQGKTC